MNTFKKACFLLAAVGCCLPALAAEIHGTVVDPSGAGIGHARVEFHNGKQTLTVFSDHGGSFVITTSATEGTLNVEARGFSPATHKWSSPDPVAINMKPASVAEEVVVTAERTQTPISATAANMISFSPEELNTHAVDTLDDALRQAPGFTLFRRASSLSANPTTLGASVRGTGASGASRILVLEDGIPLNDAFGGWVFWDRVPRVMLDRAEVLRGGGSNPYGNSALSGVVNLLTPSPAELFTVEASGNSLDGHDVQGYVSQRVHQWTFSGAGESFGNDGAFIILPANRGLADSPADLRFGNGTARVERTFSSNVAAFVQGSLFSEARNNGTLLQINSTHLGEIRTGVDAALGNNVFQFRVYGTGEHYHQSFSSVSADRNTETLVRWQTVPSDQLGFSTQWTRTASRVQLSAGVDGRFIHGESDETTFTLSRATNLLTAGGTNRIVGVFGELSAPVTKRLRVSAGAREDWWSNLNGFSTNTLLAKNTTTNTALPTHDENAFSPRAGLVYDLAGPLQLTASAYEGFRAPTLNELYRSFRLGNINTLANAQLDAERLAGGETGLRYVHNRFILSGVFFHEHVDNPVGNITLSTTPALITRQRQNIGALRAQGLDADALLVLHKLQVRAGYEYVNSEVTSFSATPTLVGKIVPQVPAHTFTFSTVYNAPHQWNIESLLRTSSSQFDDDQNQFLLAPYASLGVSVSKRVGMTSWFLSASNLTNTKIQTAATPLATYASPRIISGGVRFLGFHGK